MSEVDTIAADERRRRAEARLAASRPLREAAAAAHARTIPRGEQSDDGLVRKSLEELRLNPYRMTEAERARILAMTEEEIEAAALALPRQSAVDRLGAGASGARAQRAARGGEAQRLRIPVLAEVPVLLVCGKKEGETRTVSIRRLGRQASTTMGLEEALRLLAAEATAPDQVRAQVGEGEVQVAAE